ncbi:MAG TPA: type II secretion system protein [Pyrinomonadaceae bacterium]|nr:type II secretion system protein [Pyrinomonadaceae bacterium]
MKALASRGEGKGEGGWTLIELVVVVTILAILSVGIIPMLKTSVRRQREARLREDLREMREAIKQFKRDTVGIQCAGAGGLQQQLQQQQQQQQGGQQGQQGQQQTAIDPRSKVVISDCTIFGVENPDHYPPDLETLVAGVNVVPRINLGMGGGGPLTGNATDNKLLSLKKKVYLRRIPDDPLTGRPGGQDVWGIRSTYDPPDAESWGGENVFDVYYKGEGTALNGEKYSDW